MQCVGHQQQLHDTVVGWCASRLNEEYVLTANVLVELYRNFTIAEFANARIAQRNTNMLGNIVCQFWVGITSKDHQIIWHGEFL